MRLPYFGRETPLILRPARSADAAGLAPLHAQGFARPWSVGTFESLLADRSVTAHVAEQAAIVGFILFRSAADEAELLSIVVDRAFRRHGCAVRLLDAGLDHLVRRRVHHVFLEVEAGNTAALRLYERFGAVVIGRRPGYYAQTDGSRRDAVMMRLDISGRPLPPAVLDG